MLGPTPNRSRRARIPVAIVTAAALVLTSACGKLNPGPPPPPPIINDYVSAVQVLGDGGTSEVVNEQLGEGVPDGPIADVPTDTTVVNGGSVQQEIKSTTEFSKVRIGIEPLSSAAGPSPSPNASPAVAAPTGPKRGYHEITLTKSGNTAEVVVSIAQNLPETVFVFWIAVVDGKGKQGKLSKQKVDAVKVGTGEVQVSVSWDKDSDVDLHVVDPQGNEAYWDNTEVTSGGALDLDSNADCEIDSVRNENITWSKAPPGTYTVRLDYYRNCDIEATNYVVTVRVNGQPTKTFTGKFTGEGDEGGEGAGKTITTFSVVSASPTA